VNNLQAKFLKLSSQFSGGLHGSLFNLVETSQICTLQEIVNTANSAAFVGRPKVKKLSASGGLRPPDPLTRGSAPGPRWGLRPQTPVIGSRSRARQGPPTTKLLPTPLHYRDLLLSHQLLSAIRQVSGEFKVQGSQVFGR